MIKKIRKEQSLFERYFREADGDENDKVSVTVAPRQNRGTDYSDDSTSVKVSPRANRGTDYGADEETPDEPETGNDEDYSNDMSNDNTDSETNDSEESDDGSDADTTDDAPDEPETGDDGGEDYSDDTSDDSGDTDDGNNETDTSDDGDGEDAEEKKKKYSMYLRYLHLYELISTFSEHIRSIVKDDFTQNAVIKTVVNNLNNLYNGMYDYMVIKYKTSSYVEIMLYYETVINCVRLNFELLRNNKINLKQ